jgi:hypothetical protein
LEIGASGWFCYKEICYDARSYERNALSFVSDDFHYVLSYSCPTHSYATMGYLFCQKSKTLSVEINEKVIF